MRTISKYGFKFLFDHVLGVVLAFFILLVLGWATEHVGFLPIACLSAALYVGIIYPDAWRWGNSESKPYNEVKESPLRALAASMIPFVICIALMVWGLFDTTGIANFVTRGWYLPFAGFFSKFQQLKWYWVLICGLSLPLTAVVGYCVGINGFSVPNKMIQRQIKKRQSKT